MENLGIPREEMRRRVGKTLDQIGIRHLADRPPITLSGGQQQHFRAAGRIEELLLKLKEKYTILAVSHSLSETRRLADRVCVLREGRIVKELERQHLSDPAVFQQLIEAAF